MHGRNAIARRLSKLLFYLPTLSVIEPEDLARLAAWCSVTTRTVRRDIEALREAGFKVPPFAYRRAA